MSEGVSWFLNPDAVDASDHGIEWAQWSRYTRNPPVYSGDTTDEIAAYTPTEQVIDSAIHESAHAVLFMAAGCRISHITLHDPDTQTVSSGQAQVNVDYTPPTCTLAAWGAAVAVGERAEDRWLRESGLWTRGRAWVAERLAWMDRRRLALAYRDCSGGKPLTFHGDHNDPGDYAWFTDRADRALDRVWGQVLALAHCVVEHRTVNGEVAARIAGVARS